MDEKDISIPNSSTPSDEYHSPEDELKESSHQKYDSTQKKDHQVSERSQSEISPGSSSNQGAVKGRADADMDWRKSPQAQVKRPAATLTTTRFLQNDNVDIGKRSDNRDWRSGPTTNRPENDRDFVRRPCGGNTMRTEVSRHCLGIRRHFGERPIGGNASQTETSRRYLNDPRDFVGNPRGRYRGEPIDHNLKQLSSLKDDDLLIGVVDTRSRFFVSIEKHLSNSDPYHTNQMPTIFELLARIPKCTHSNAISNRFLIDVLNTPSFTLRLQRLVTTEIIEIAKNGIWQAMVIRKLLQDMVVTITSMLERIENQSYHRLHLIVGGMEILFQSLKAVSIVRTSVVDEETFELLSEMLRVDAAITDKYISLNERSSEWAVKPPDNFRDYDIIPMENELDGSDDSVFLRENRVCGKYLSVDDYLDVQFRLMREDFIAPLRKGMNEYRDQALMFRSDRKRITDVRIYENTRICKEHWLNSGVGFVIQLDHYFLAKQFNWETNKRLIYGSLLAFWDKELNKIFLAVIEDRQVPMLSKYGQFVVRVMNEDITNDHLRRSYVMFESTAFFEAYRHVLMRLKTITSNDMPFSEHLVECNQRVLPPAYLDTNTLFDFNCISINRTSRMKTRALLAENSESEESETSESEDSIDDKNDRSPKPLSIDDFLTRPVGAISLHEEIYDDTTFCLDIDDWLTAEELGLDDSQYSALQNAVMKRLSVIQGPPGTGKTYIGLKVAKLLLKNVIEPSHGEFGPMLLVCYTNHALDQFLEGIVAFKTDYIVRVGSRSKSALLEEYKLSNVRREYSLRHFALEQDSYQFDHEMQFLKEESVFLKHLFEAATESLMKMNILGYFISQEHYIAIVADASSLIEEEEQLLAWLFSDAFETIDDEAHEAITEVVDEIATHCADEEIRNIISSVTSNKDRDAGITILDIIDFETSQRQLDEEEDSKDVRDECEHAKELAEKCVKEEFTQLGEIKAVINKNVMHYISSELNKRDYMNEEEEAEVLNPWYLPQPEKWRLYRLWRQRYQLRIKQKQQYVSERYDQLCKEHTQLRTHADLAVFRNQDLIAMTTTGAARYGEVLSVIKPRIVIVEEAAEVFESHIISSLSSGCEHLILIGDHKQLRPSPAVYQLAKRYNLDVSLFERLIRNKFPYSCLTTQHRMRPEISRLLRLGGIYPELEDHSSVEDYPMIKGVSSNVFFMNHQHPESQNQDSTSHSNTFEAEFAVRLCLHFILQGYRPSQITILTLYSGQLFLIKQFLIKHDTIFDGLTVTVVDNYQGEENDIIILSLVRSNLENIIGFVGIENRICVALSRARMGLFVLGNFDLMKKKSTLWSTIVNLVEEENQIGNGIKLVCQLHPEGESHLVKCASDFDKFSPNGGCGKTCSKRLSCGHICIKPCHIEDQRHLLYECRQICSQLCDRGLHEYKFYCFQKRLKCSVMIDQEVPSCGHTVAAPCYENNLRCTTIVEKTLGCGHVIEVACWKSQFYVNCTFKCNKPLQCGHFCTDLCHHNRNQDHERYFCKELCSKLCKRGLHDRQLRCHEHTTQCTVRIEQEVTSCGHKIQAPCHYQQSDLKCTFPCAEKLSCGHRCTGKCGEPHTSVCHELVEKELKVCKHAAMLECSSTVSKTTKCLKRCEKTLACGHKCRGCCEDCTEDILHLPCMYPCNRTLICGHKCNRPCTRYCPPCKKPCLNQCEHSKCKRTCSMSCFKCKESCPNQCEHGRCTRRCHEVCDHKPCDKPCQRTFFCRRCKTNVQCLSLCGEKCIKLCRNCDRSIFRKTFFGEEDKPDALFIMLRTCGHLFEKNGLDSWMKSKDGYGIIKAKVCPRCARPITMSSCRRYLDICRRHMKIVEQVNKEIQSMERTLNQDVVRLQLKLRNDRNLQICLLSKVQRCRSRIDLILTQNIFNVAIAVEKLENRLLEIEKSTRTSLTYMNKSNKTNEFIEHVKVNLARIQRCLRRFSVTEEVLKQCRSEVNHIHDMLTIIELYSKALKSTRELDSLENLWLRCSSRITYNNNISSKIINELVQVNTDQFKSGLHISTMKPIECLPSFGLSEGNWYICPKGHVFPITADEVTLDGHCVCDKC